ncbi:TIGR04290 family methyltransferase [Afifella sp. JA880]|uniref:TIGR04290 family methyltransferase n=1 Tax=Afifella sp. JA880 TaxID=2975280 RepID=UPI0028E09F6B|nr:TIGR04290 family methyltransferase [Afifella sp. JA880]
MQDQKLRNEISALAPWFHNLHLPGGFQTAPDHFLGDFPRFKWDQIAPSLPEDLRGWRVLDIGANAGFYSFALAERGAEVVGIDSDPHYLRQAEWAAERFGGNTVSFHHASVYEVDEIEGSFDLILFMGVFYHLRHPLLALDMLARLRPKLLLFQTLTFGDESVSPHARHETNFETRALLEEKGWPKMAFIEESFCADPTNWWVANHAAVEAMLRSAGFKIVGRPGHEIYLCECDGGEPAHREETGEAQAAVKRLNAAEGY